MTARRRAGRRWWWECRETGCTTGGTANTSTDATKQLHTHLDGHTAARWRAGNRRGTNGTQ